MSCSLVDQDDNEWFHCQCSKHFNLEEPNNNKFLMLFKISKTFRQSNENSKELVDIKKEDVKREWDPSQDECKITELK